MESITTPLLKQLEATNKQYDITVAVLIEGDPTYMTEIHKLSNEMNKLIGLVKQVMAHIQSNMESENKTINDIENALKGSVFGFGSEAKTWASTAYTSQLKVSILPFILSEINNITKIINEITKLLGKVTDLAPIIAFLISEVNKLKSTLSADLIKLESRLKLELDKAEKNKDWIQAELEIDFDEMVSNYRISLYTDTYYEQTNQKAKEYLQAQIESEKRKINVSIPSRRLSLKEDKEYWDARWKKEAEKYA